QPRLLDHVVDAPIVLEQRLPGARQADASRASVDQLRAELLLEGRDAFARLRSGNAELCRGFLETQGFGDSHEQQDVRSDHLPLAAADAEACRSETLRFQMGTHLRRHARSLRGASAFPVRGEARAPSCAAAAPHSSPSPWARPRRSLATVLQSV